MTLWQQLMQSVWTQRLGWTLLHALWEGAVIWALLAMLLMVFGKVRAQVGYVMCCGALAALVVLPVITFVRQDGVTAAPAPTGGPKAHIVVSQADPVTTPSTVMSSASHTAATKPQAFGWAVSFMPYLPGLVTTWLAGVCLMALWHVGGWLLMRRRYLGGTALPPPALGRQFASLAKGFSVRATLLLSERIATPLALGLFRPVVLFPAALLTGLSPDQVKALLLHELAHIRRHDYLVNLLQTLAETLLFYHPAAWWISRQMRRQRELCCDDLVLALTDDRRAYASALAVIAECPAGPALPAAGGELVAHIRRIATGQQGKSVSWLGALLSAGILMMMAGVLINAGCQTRAAVPLTLVTPSAADVTEPARPNPTVPELVAELAGPSPYHNTPNLSGQESMVRAYMRQLRYQPRPTDVPALLAAMDDANRPLIMRLCVAGYLLELKNQAAQLFLLGEFDSDDRTRIQESAHAILSHVHPEDSGDWATAQIVRALADDHLMQARYAYEIFYDLGQKKIKAAEPALIAALRRNPASEDLAGAVASYEDDASTESLVATVEYGGRLARMQAAVLANRKYPGISKVLARHLDDDTGTVATMLCYLDDTSVLPALRDYVAAHPQSENATFYRIAIVRLESSDAHDRVIRLGWLLDHTDDHSSCGTILEMLREPADPAAVPPILRLLQRSSDRGNLMDGIFALDKISGPQSTRALVTLLDREFVDDGGRGKPTSPFSLQEWAIRSLEQRTGQKFGADKQKWRDYAAGLPAN